jgi:hypothetical protein
MYCCMHTMQSLVSGHVHHTAHMHRYPIAHVSRLPAWPAEARLRVSCASIIDEHAACAARPGQAERALEAQPRWLIMEMCGP